MKLSQSFVVVSLSMAAHSQVGLSAVIPNSPEPNLLSPRSSQPARLGHQSRSPRPESSQEDQSDCYQLQVPQSTNPMRELFSRSPREKDHPSHHRHQESENNLLDLSINLKKREIAGGMEKRGIDGLLTPLGVTSLDGTVKTLPLVGETLSTAAIEPLEKALDPTVGPLLQTLSGTVAGLPIVGGLLSDVLKQRSLLDPVKDLPVVGPVVAGALDTVTPVVQPVVDTVLSTVHSLPIVGPIVPSSLPLKKRTYASSWEYDQPALVSYALFLKKKRDTLNPLSAESGLLNQAGGAFPIEPSTSLDHLTLPNQIIPLSDAGETIDLTHDLPSALPSSTNFPVELPVSIVPIELPPKSSQVLENGAFKAKRDERNYKISTMLPRAPLPTINEDPEPGSDCEEDSEFKPIPKLSRRSELQNLFKRRLSFINQTSKNNLKNRSLSLKKLIKESFK